MKNLYDGIMLDSYNVFIPYTYTRGMIAELLNKNHIETETTTHEYYEIRTMMFDHKIHCAVLMRFQDEKMFKILMAPINFNGDIIGAYKRIQTELGSILGKYGKPVNMFRYIMNRISEYKYSIWHLQNVEIEHDLYDRFGFEDTVTIRIK